MSWSRGTPRAHPPAPQPPEVLHRALMALNHPDAPFRIRDAQGERADLVAEWKIEDRRWAGLFHAAGMRRTTRTLMRLDTRRHELRSVDQLREVEWATGIGSLRASISFGRGQINRVWWHARVGPDGVRQDGFSTKQIKEPIKQTVAAAGWRWRGVYLWL